MGQGESEVKVVEILYRPVVREVNVVLKSGEERNLRPQPPKIKSRARRGIPMFRFLVIPLEDGACIQHATSYDGQGNALKNEKMEGCA
jgi:hypothetical protein